MAPLVMERPVSLIVDEPATLFKGAIHRWVYLFNQLDELEATLPPGDWDAVRSLLGGKGANLAEMTRIGIPVPPGFSITTEACNAYLRHDRQFPPGLWEQQLAALSELEVLT